MILEPSRWRCTPLEGVTVTVSDPAWPGVRVRVFAADEDGVMPERAIVNSHSVATLTCTAEEVEVRMSRRAGRIVPSGYGCPLQVQR